MFRLACLVSVWGRPAVAEAALEHLLGLEAEGVAISVWAAYSPEDPDSPAYLPPVRYVGAPNEPLSEKWNALALRLRSEGVDAAMQVDSDSFVSAGYVAAAVRALQRGAALAYAREITVLDVDTGRAMRARPVRPGPGRTLSAAALEALGWRPWPPGLDRKLNGAMDARLRSAGLARAAEACVEPAPGVEVLEVKGLWGNVWGGFDRLAPYRTAAEDADAVAGRFPAVAPLLAGVPA